MARETQTAHFKRARNHWWQGPNLHFLNLSTAIPYSLLKCVISQENFERARQSNRKCSRNPNLPILNLHVSDANNKEFLIDNNKMGETNSQNACLNRHNFMVYSESLNTFYTAPFATLVFKYIQRNLSAMNVEPQSTSLAFNNCSEPLWEPLVILTERHFTRKIHGIFIMKTRPPVSAFSKLHKGKWFDFTITTARYKMRPHRSWIVNIFRRI
jgi:hypothetical protein